MDAFIKGSNLNLYYTINGYQYPAAHATDCKISVTGETQETTTKDGIKGKTYNYTGKYSYTLSLSGITNFIDVANIGVFQQAILQSNKLQFVFTDSVNVQWSGTVLITQTDADSNVKSISTFTNSMIGDGELTLIDNAVPPAPPGSSVRIVDQFGNLIATITAPGTYNVLRFDTIYQGGASPITPQIIIMQAS